MPTSTVLYEIKDGLDLEDAKERLPEVELSRDGDHLQDLKTEFNDVRNTDNGLNASIRFQLEEKRGGWDGAKYEKETYQHRIRLLKDVRGIDGVMIIAKADHQPKIASRMIDFFGVGPTRDDPSEGIGMKIVKIHVPDLQRILDDDAVVESRATYKSIDENTQSASLAGALQESDPAEAFERSGEKRWVIFESKSFEKKVGITTKNDAVVFWGDWSDADMERYWSRVVLPNID